jgi:hypothetical protein
MKNSRRPSNLRVRWGLLQGIRTFVINRLANENIGEGVHVRGDKEYTTINPPDDTIIHSDSAISGSMDQ